MRYQDENIWLTQRMMATLYSVEVPTINEHIKKVFTDSELTEEATIRNIRIVQTEGARKVEREIIMTITSAKLTFLIPHAASLKDKRQVAKSIIEKTRHRFNASVAEVDTQDLHRTLTIGVAVVSGSVAHAQNSLDEIIRFMEDNADAELQNVVTD